MKSLLVSTLLLLTSSTALLAGSPVEIMNDNTRAVVYLEIDDGQGQFIDSGTGFVVSSDGYVVTAAHIKVDPGQTLYGVVGQRQGTKFALEPRESDAGSDVAVWQLPQASTCRQSVIISTKSAQVLDRAVVLGFPGRDGLTPAPVNIQNLHGDGGMYKSDGFLREGYSGGPVFNEDGQVIAIVSGGSSVGGGNNNLVPIALAVDLLKKRGVAFAAGAPIPFEDRCYATCRAREHGIEKWTSEISWEANSGELSGGHTQIGECDKLKAAALVGHPDSEINFLPGSGTENTTGMWEKSWKDFVGNPHYVYYCKGVLRSGAVYRLKQSPACGLWQ
jgi:hypothetical protein